MLTLIASFLVLLLGIVVMSIGIILGRKPITGSCGGLKSLGDINCEVCGGDTGKCPKSNT